MEVGRWEMKYSLHFSTCELLSTIYYLLIKMITTDQLKEVLEREAALRRYL